MLDQGVTLENTWMYLSPLSQVLDLLSRAQSYSLHKLRIEVWSTLQRLGHIRWRGYPFREFGNAQVHVHDVLQEQVQLLHVKGISCRNVSQEGAAGWRLLRALQDSSCCGNCFHRHWIGKLRDAGD